ncbi:MAG TPA: ABC transporter ATP-binding protein [Ignavibacteria bacterium]|nr:ABC transporter ATP-binding protein [Ignavibacteria bacterium]HMR39890.1 ABC transporter ATP-binding protein [Ignavibacteria bacterium]
MDNAVVIKNLNKSYGDLKVLDNINISVQRNIIFGLVGPDGAGKTTLIKILCGLLGHDSGEAEVLGIRIPEGIKNIKNDIGYLSQRFSLYTDLTVDENIEFIANIHGLKDFKKRRDELLGFTRLTKFRNFAAGKLSGGMKQKLALSCTLIYRPKIIFLDEPTTGVDPVSRREFWIILSNLIKEDITIIISTPYMDEAERFNKLAMIDKGKMLAYDTPARIKTIMNQEIIEVVCNPVRKAYRLLNDADLYEVQIFGDRLNVSSEYEKIDAGNIEKILKDNSVQISDIRKIPPSLENAFIHLIKENN